MATITTNGVSLGGVSLIINAVGQTISLNGDITTTTVATLSAGTLDLNGANLNCTQFAGTGTTTRSIAFGSSYINLYSATVGVVNLTDTTNFSYTSVTGGFNFTGNAASALSRSIISGTTGGSVTTAPPIKVSAGQVGSIIVIGTGSYIGDFDLTGFSGTLGDGTVRNINWCGNLIFNSVMTLSLSTGTQTFIATSSKTLSTQNIQISGSIVTFNGVGGIWNLSSNFLTNGTITLTAGRLALGNRTMTVGNISSTGTGVRGIDFGTGLISTTATGPLLTDLSNFTATGTGAINLSATAANLIIGTTTNANTIPPGIKLTAALSGATIQNNSSVGNLDLSSASGTLNNYNGMSYNVYGSLVMGTVTFGTTPTINFLGTSNNTIKSANVSYIPTFNGLGNWTLVDNLSAGSSTLTLTQGNLILNNFTANVFTFTSAGTGVRGINFGSSNVQINTTGTGTIVSLPNLTNFTPTGTGGFRIMNVSASRTIDIGSTAGGSANTAVNLSFGAGSSTQITTIQSGSWLKNLTAISPFGGNLVISNATITGNLVNNIGNLNANTGTITIYNAATDDNYISAPSKIFNNITLAGPGTGNFISNSGNIRFTTFNSTRTNSYAVTLSSGNTTYVTSWQVVGSNAYPITLNATTSGNQATLSISAGTVDPGYATIKDSNATGGATFSAPTATDGGNNTGWTFAPAPPSTSSGNFFLMLM